MRIAAIAMATVAAACTTSARAQDAGPGGSDSDSTRWVIVGLVRDSASGVPITGATVSLTKAQALVDQVRTDASGGYRLRAPGIGNYAVRTSRLGYAVDTRAVRLDSTARTVSV